jgi:hypothetical protein
MNSNLQQWTIKTTFQPKNYVSEHPLQLEKCLSYYKTKVTWMGLTLIYHDYNDNLNSPVLHSSTDKSTYGFLISRKKTVVQSVYNYVFALEHNLSMTEH